MSAPREIESKYAADAGVLGAAASLSAAGRFTLTPGPTADQVNTYYDTSDGRLRAARHGFRIRAAGGRLVATLKGPADGEGHTQRRAEWEAELPADDPAALPEGDVRRELEALTGGAPLLPLLTVRTRRRTLLAALEAGPPCVELALDEGEVLAGGRSAPISELELELLGGADEALLHELAGELAARFPLTPEPRSKLQRGLALLDEARRTHQDPPEHGVTMEPTADSPTLLPAAAGRLPAAALALFDGAGAAHGLPAKARPLAALAAAALEAAAGAEHPGRAARDALLAAPIAGLGPDDQALAACAAAFAFGKVRPSRETASLRLGERGRARAVRLAALLQLAGAVASSPAARLAVRGEEAETVAHVEGPGMAAAGADLSERAVAWRKEIGPLAVVAGDLERAGEAPAPGALPEVPAAPGELAGGEGAAEGARRALRQFFERMLAREDAVRKGEDPEDVHQMRVATRRLRASLQVVEGLYEPGLARRLRRGLRRAADSLGAVRDRDVLLAHLAEFAGGLPEGERDRLDPLVQAVAAERAEAREELLRELAGERYQKLKRRAAEFLTAPGGGLAELPETGAPPRVRDVAGSQIWRRYEELRAFEVALEGGGDSALHRARIAGKRLRYTLELFAPALGPRADELLAQLADLQDHLGQIQDGVAARERIDALGMGELPGAQAYLAHLEARRAALAADLPRAWGKVAGGTYRRRLMELIVKL